MSSKTNHPLPTVMVVGPMKSGTTWLYRYLHARGDICLPRGVKETFFFDYRWNKPQRWYRSHFRHYDPLRHKQIVEVAPTYFASHNVPQRIRALCGDVPIIITLRDPIERAWSHYLHLRSKGYTNAALREAAEAFPTVITASQYVDRLREWQAVFGKQQLHVLLHDELQTRADHFAAQACRALNLRFTGVPSSCLGPSNAASLAPTHRLAKAGRLAADRLRDYRLYPLLEGAKRLGLKQIFFGSSKRRTLPAPSTDDRAYLAEQLLPQLPTLEQMLYRSLDEWKRTPMEISATPRDR
jgi:hypothetical protein